jgi:spore coat protein CotH
MRRLKHRLPVRLRHHWKVVAACGIFFAVLVGLVGTSRVAPIVTSDERADADVVVQDIPGTVDLFDTSRPHELTLSYSPEDYERMLDQYWEDGDKEYLEADLVVDGTRIDSVGIRLKGNSTLSGMTRDGQTAPRGFGDRGEEGVRVGPPAGGAGPRDFGQAGGGFRGGGMGGLRAEEPENLPWLVSFDEYVEGRRYQGRTEIAVRPATGMGGSTTGLNEAVALSLVAASGEPSQRYTFSTFTVNDRPTVTRLVVEHPDRTYADSLPGDGVLYKSQASGQFADQGDDQTDYQDDFEQVNKKGSQDLRPVIELIRWVGSASDAEFAAGLADRVDTASFARYVALQNLLLNFDDMSGPGSNYYLYYNLDTRKFTVITWDLNLAMSGDATQGPNDAGRMGGFVGAGPGGERGQPPEGFEPPEGFQLPEGFEPPEGFQPPDGGPGPGGGMRMRGHQLKERFLADPELKKVYENAYRDLYQRLYASGAAATAVEQTSAILKAAGANASTVDSEAAALRTLVDSRTKSLATDEVITRR